MGYRVTMKRMTQTTKKARASEGLTNMSFLRDFGYLYADYDPDYCDQLLANSSIELFCQARAFGMLCCLPTCIHSITETGELVRSENSN